ncbi:MAG: hypothetical protein HY562_10750 [Ignavibacteriales bacterium]|nr:hypothetical protein [Ignavibacteriales bacterium]
MSLVNALAAQQSSQSIGQWKNFTDMKTVRALTGGSGVLWAATAGGSFSYNSVNSSYRKFTNSDGISSNDLTAISLDQSGAVWVGASDGSINVLENGWRNIRDIAVSNRIQRSVKKFVQQGDTMLVVSDFGISVYLMVKREFGDTYSNFGFSTPASVNSLLIQGNRIWVATNQGVATAVLGSSNLTSPTAWTRYGTTKGLPSANTISIGVLSDTVVVGCDNGAAFFSADTFIVISAFSGRLVADIEQKGSSSYALLNSSAGFSVEMLDQTSGPVQVISTNPGTQGYDLLLSPSTSDLWVSTSTIGIVQWDGAAWSYLSPNGPQSNLFNSIAVDNGGVLWAASGSSGGRGFYRYDPSKADGAQWKNFTKNQYPILPTDDYYKVSVGGGSVWVSSWGSGVVEVVEDTIRRRIDASSTPSLTGSVLSNPSYVVVGSVFYDGESFPWFVNFAAIDKNYLARLVNDTTFVYYRNLYNSEAGSFFSMVIDREGTKWFANSEPTFKSAGGLYYFNENGLVSGTQASGGWGYISTTDGLPNAYVVSLAVDHTGDVWVGTDLGVLIITDPLFPKTRRTGSFALREQSVQAIAVDGLNNKWVGTREGVFVVNADGTQLLEQHTVLTTGGRLVSDDVRSIAIDQRRGIVYFGTEKGLSSLNIEAVQTKEAFASLEVGPNPYLLPNDEQLVIRDLVNSTTIKILTLTGSLVSEFKAQGAGRAFWDGRDSQGQLVSSGVYFIVAFAENGNQVATAKVAVVRR